MLCIGAEGFISCQDLDDGTSVGGAGPFYSTVANDSTHFCSVEFMDGTIDCFKYNVGPESLMPISYSVTSLAVDSCATFWVGQGNPQGASQWWMALRGGLGGVYTQVLPNVSVNWAVINDGWLYWTDATAIGAIPVP